MTDTFKINRFTITLDDESCIVDCDNPALWGAIETQVTVDDDLYYIDNLNKQYWRFYTYGCYKGEKMVFADVFDSDRFSDAERDVLVCCCLPLEFDFDDNQINGSAGNTANSAQPRTAITLRELLALLPDDVYVQVLPFSYHECDIIPIDVYGEAGSKSFLIEAEPLAHCPVRSITPISLDVLDVDSRASSQTLKACLNVWIDSPGDDSGEQPAHQAE